MIDKITTGMKRAKEEKVTVEKFQHIFRRWKVPGGMLVGLAKGRKLKPGCRREPFSPKAPEKKLWSSQHKSPWDGGK